MAGGNRARLLATAAAIGILLGACAVATPAVAQQLRAEWAPAMGIDDYAWIDRADTLTETIGEAPPDYSFVYDDAEPWAWQLDDGSLVITEQRPDGPHSYFYDPGTATPFLVRDRDISYAFVRGQVAVIYGPDGAVVAREQGEVWLDDAAYARRRGEALYRAWKRRDDRPVAVSAWIDFSFLFYDWNRHWSEGRSRHWRWKRWRERHDRHSDDWRRRLEEEQRRRELLADRFRRWREERFTGTPPGRWQRPSEGWQPRGPGGWTGRGGTGEGPRRPRPERVDGTPAPAVRSGGMQRWSRGDRAGHPPAPVVAPEANVAAPVAVATPAPTPAPAPRPRWSDRSGEPRSRPTGDRPRVTAPVLTERPNFTPPVRTERPSFTPPMRVERPSYTPPVVRSAPTPSPSPPPTRTYTPAPSPAPAPAPSSSSSGRTWGRDTSRPN